MLATHPFRFATLVLPGLFLLVLAGCFESEHPVTAPKTGGIDKRYIGDWSVQQGPQSAKLIVRNLHDEEYYVEWVNADGTRSRQTAHASKVNGATFANLLPVRDDGALATKYVIVRVDLKGDRLTIRNLNPEFFKDKTIGSSDDLKAILSANLDNDSLYTADPILATRAAAEQHNAIQK